MKWNEPESRNELAKFAMFLLAGGIVFVVYTSLVWVLMRKLMIEDVYATSLAYVVSTLVHFLLNNFFTFGYSKVGYKRRVLGYLSVIGCNYLIMTLLVIFVLRYIVDSIFISSMIATTATILFGFFALNKIVYNKETR